MRLQPVKSEKRKAGGVSLNLTSAGADARDAEFERV
jgi:hypothetical protein